MQIDVEKLDELIEKADGIFLSGEQEQVLLDFIAIEQQVENARDAIKKKLEEAGLKKNPDFKSIQADRVKVYYRQFGSRYKIDESKIQNIPAVLYSEKMTYSPNIKEIDVWAETHKGLPDGILEPERPKQLTFSLKEKAEATT